MLEINSNYWLMSGDLANLTFTPGWIILQGIEYDRVSGPLNADWVEVKQIVVLSSTGQIQWLASYGQWAVS